MGFPHDDSLIVIVPVKPLAEAKHRLGRAIDVAARTELSKRMLGRTLRVLRRARGVMRVAVVSRDEVALKLARRLGAWSIWESGRGLNAALEQATWVAVANGAGAVLILPADLPNLTTGDVEQMIEQGRPRPCVVIAPALRDQGTNGLVVNPAGLIRYAFGPRSFIAHKRLAEQAGAQVKVYRSERVAFDVDLPEDLEKLERTSAKRR